MLGTILNYVLLALGFGFVIFWHELGHFAAAKWAGVKVEQFALGFGPAIFAWRKGLGLTWGSTARKFEARNNAEREGVNPSETNSIGETEYRLNWLPLGGYVKMLGQDDMNPNATVDDPRAYNTQPISKRMVIVSAGVIMNVILAAIGFFILFMHGFTVQPAVVGAVLSGSPAQRAGLKVGDEIITLDGTRQHDFTKIMLNVALLSADEPAPIEVKRTDGNIETLQIRAQRNGDIRGMLALGIVPPGTLNGVSSKQVGEDFKYDPKMHPPEANQVRPDETIVEVAGTAITDADKQAYILDRALQASQGNPVPIIVKSPDGSTRTEMVQPHFLRPFIERADLDFLGMIPRAMVSGIIETSLVKDQILPGDIITSIRVVKANDPWENPTQNKLMELINGAGESNDEVQFTVLRDAQSINVKPVAPKLKNDNKRLGVGIGLDIDDRNTVIGGLLPDSSALRAGVPRNATILAINDQPVSTWYDVQRIVEKLPADKTVSLSVLPMGSKEPATFQLSPSREEVARADSYVYTHSLILANRMITRHTNNPIEAATWGVGETRDLIIQFYLTIKRMVQRSVPASNLMGPYGIVVAGSAFANRGTDWLIWFLAMISANLAVVNFLPIPIVDGGLFLFLIIEKIQGRPLSNRTQSIAQVVGLALIASVVVFVTYQDIVR